MIIFCITEIKLCIYISNKVNSKLGKLLILVVSLCNARESSKKKIIYDHITLINK